MVNKVIFRLKRFWIIDGKTVDLYEEIKSGRKTSEWRDDSLYWLKRLAFAINLTKAWFTIGYPKNNLPRLEADIKSIILHKETEQIEIQFTNVKEVKT